MLSTIRRITSRLARVFGSWKISQTPGVLFSGPTSTAGVSVTTDDALSLSAVFAAVNLISGVIGSLPLTVYRKWGRAREQATTHPAWRLLHLSPNPEMTPASFVQAMEWNRLLGGNAYASVQWAGNGKPIALWPIEFWRVRHKRREDGSLYFEVDGQQQIEPEDMLHVPQVTADGVTGRSFLEWAIESLGLGIATQQFAASYFGNGARPGGLLKHPGNPPREQREEFRRSWSERHGGPANASKTGVLFGGWEYVADSFNAEQSQLIEQRRFTTEEVARWLNIPPHLLRDLNRATFSNIEQQNIDFLIYSLTPVLVKHEQELNRKLLSPPETYAKFGVKGLLRGDSTARAAFYSQMIQIGIFSVNECREWEEESPVDGGDVHFFPLNMAPLPSVAFPIPVVPETPPPQPTSTPGATPAPAAEVQPALARQITPAERPHPVLSMLLAQTLERLWKVERNAISRAAEKPREFTTWVLDFYPSHEAKLSESLAFVVPLCLGSAANPVACAEAWCAESKAALDGFCDTATPATLGTVVARWIGEQAGRSSLQAAQWMRGSPCQQ